MELDKVIGLMKNHSREDYENQWDVQVLVDGRLFKCQRLSLAIISERLDTVFSSSTTPYQQIYLRWIHGAAFEDFLDCMFTGDLRVNESNVFQLLVLNDSLKLRPNDFKNKCLEFVKNSSKKPDPISDAFDLLCFAHSKEENVLVDTLYAHICRHLYHFSKDSGLTEISFENLKALLVFGRDYVAPSPTSSDVLLAIIHNWVNFNREERSKHRCDLIKSIDYSKVSSDFSYLLMMRLEKAADEASLAKDVRAISELTTLEVGIDLGDIGGNARLKSRISLNVKKINTRYSFWEVSRPVCVIANLFWRLRFSKIEDEVCVGVQCTGSYLTEEWNCYASAIFTVESHREGREDYESRSELNLFSHSMERFIGCVKYLEVKDLVNPKNGFIEDDGSITIYAVVQVDVPFLSDDLELEVGMRNAFDV